MELVHVVIEGLNILRSCAYASGCCEYFERGAQVERVVCN